MSNQTMVETVGIVEQVGERTLACLQDLGGFLTDPADRERFAERIRSAVDCEAVSIFMSEDDPNRLDLTAGVGYTGNYAQTKYYMSGATNFLTSYVYGHRKPINMSCTELQQEHEHGGVPFSGRCRLFIGSHKFVNLIAVPILVHAQRCVGVLKMENKVGTTESQKFPDEDFAFAQVLASLIGVGYQQRVYGRLLGGGSLGDAQTHRRNIGPYLQACTELLAQHIRTECVSVFVREQSSDGKDILRYGAGVGYREGYQKHVYDFGAKTSFTVSVANFGVAIIRSEKELVAGKGTEPYTGACVEYIKSGEFRNILAIPLMDNETNLGVLKLENKLPPDETFDESDLKICTEFAQQQIVKELLKVGSYRGPDEATKGFRFLVSKLGPPPDKRAMLARAKRVDELQRQHPDQISGNDCADYLRISRPHYYRIKKSYAKP